MLTAKDIKVLRMIIRQEVARTSGSVSSTSATPSNSMYATAAPVADTYVVSNALRFHSMTEDEYNEYLSKMTV
jgi:hypothetical protein